MESFLRQFPAIGRMNRNDILLSSRFYARILQEFAALDTCPQEEIERLLHRVLQINGGSPAKQLSGVADAWFSVLYILVAGAVVGAAFNLPETGKWRKLRPKRVLFEFSQQQFRQTPDADFIIWIPYVNDLAVADAAFVLDDSVQALYAIRNICETAFLLAAVDQQDRCPFHEVEDELRDGTRAADSGGG